MIGSRKEIVYILAVFRGNGFLYRRRIDYTKRCFFCWAKRRTFLHNIVSTSPFFYAANKRRDLMILKGVGWGLFFFH